MRTTKRILIGFFAALLTVTLLPAAAKADPPQSGCPKDSDGRHSWVIKAAFPAECEVQGRTIWKCENCGEEYTEYWGKPMGHSWSDWDAEGEPTCTESAYSIRVCNWCGKIEEKTEPALGHNWSEWDLEGEPTCTESAYSTRVCNRCGKIEERTEPALGHSWNAGEVTKAATCTEEGVKTISCTRCGEKKTETVPKTEHTPVTVPGKAATCTQTGLTEGQKCSVCGVVIKKQETISATGHRWDEGLVTKMPTDTEDGEMTCTCRWCGKVKTEKIPAGTPTPSIYQTAVIAEDAGKGKAVDNAFVYFDRVITNTGNCPLTVSYGYERVAGSVLPDGTVLGEVDWMDVPLQPGESLTLNCVTPVYESSPGVFALEYTSWGCGGKYIKEDGTEGYVSGNDITIAVSLTPPENPSARLGWVEWDHWDSHAGEGKLLAGASVQAELYLINDGDRPFTVILDGTASVSGIAGGSHTLNPGDSISIIQQGTVLPEMVEAGVFEKDYSFTCSYKTDEGGDGSIETNTVTVSIPLTAG